MCRFLHILLIIEINIIFSQCYIPHLSVKRLNPSHDEQSVRCQKYLTFKFSRIKLKKLSVDGNIVQRKRQDTLDMCRIFNAEYAAGNVFDNVKDKIYIRNKRSINHQRTEIEDHRDPNHKPVVKFDPNDVVNDPDDDVTVLSAENRDDFEDNIKIKMNQHLADDDMPIVDLHDVGSLQDLDKGKESSKQKQSKEIESSKENEDKDLKVTTETPNGTYSTQSTIFGPNGWSTDFAPKQLMGPQETDDATKRPDDEPTEPVKWHKRWKHGIVPFYIDPKTYDSLLGNTIITAFDYFEKATCIRLQRLRERPTDEASLKHVEWLYITNPTGIRQCVHSNEQKENSGVQMVVFGYDCMSLGEIIHEIMHVLGFSHEHVRRDRDKYVQIMWDNIKPGYKKYFVARNEETLLHIPYDYTSVMHYPPRAFSKNGQMTIMTEGKKIGQREGLSEVDAEKVNYVYAYECLERNKLYLLQTCPTVVSNKNKRFNRKNVTKDEIEDYYQDRTWNFGIVNYKFHDSLQFTIEERQNIMAVIEHIEKETCLQFRNTAKQDEASEEANLDYYHDDDNGTDAKNANNDHVKMKENREEEDVLEKDRDPTYDAGVPTLQDDPNDSPLGERRVLGYGGARKNLYTPKPGNLKSKHKIYGRRHAQDILILARVEEVGCKCPKPGRPSGNQVLNISADCFQSVNDLLHLFVHMLGLDHQHNMYDRDSYLHILWDNLTPEVKSELKEKLPPAASLGFPYDYQSVMHYPWLQIKNGVTNIMYPIWNDGWAMGHWQGLSSTDVQKIKLLYSNKCGERTKQEKSK